MITLASGLGYFDLEFQGLPRIIATAVVHTSGGVALIDPGPSTTLPMVRRELKEAGLRLEDVTTLLLTHIHLDHAGATGTLVRENPAIRVYVHERGAPHLINPEKLLASATRLYEDAMERLWGEVRPVPAESIVRLVGGERIQIDGVTLDVEYTPGHASHHVSYFARESRIAFVGDVAGIRRTADGYVLPPTPPPDVDLEAWRRSIGTIERYNPETLFLTHFGPSAPVMPHLADLSENLETAGDLAKQCLVRGDSDEEREEWFAEGVRRELRRRMSADDLRAYEVAARFDLNWRGLARYWRKKAGQPT